MRIPFRSSILLTLLALASPNLRADEGMWTFDNLPLEQMKARYGFTPDQAWLDHARLAALRFPHGSGSFISSDGLVLTNHHVGHDFILQVSDAGHDYIRDGFVAKARAQELKVPGLALKNLVSCENITARIEQAEKSGKSRQEAIEALLATERKGSALACESVSLYQGGEEWLYRYKVFTDVRLVMAPEYDIAAFGKDWDNFSYPRHDLDFSLWRVYENGQPYHPSDFLKWSEKGAANGDMTLVVGHPGRTSRLETLAQIQFRRDVQNPLLLRSLDRQRKTLRAFAAKNGESARLVSAALMSIENGYKVYAGELLMLRDGKALENMEKAEQRLRASVALDSKLKDLAGNCWDRIQECQKTRTELAPEERLLLSRSSTLVRGPLEGALRLLAASDATLKAGIPDLDVENRNLEIALLACGLREVQEELGSQHPLTQALLAGQPPEEVAHRVMIDTTLLDPAARKALLDGGPKAIRESRDPLLQLARQLEPLRKNVRQRVEALTAMMDEHSLHIAKARFAVYGKAVYPDATFTLRLSYGAVATYPQNGTLAQPFTTFGGLYDRADAWGPAAEDASWALPARWVQRRGTLTPSTPFNFITSNDIIGGNSGSPVLNRQGELVGLAFDGNIESHLGRYTFNPANNRCLCVDARAILEALAKVYDADAIVQELRH